MGRLATGNGRVEQRPCRYRASFGLVVVLTATTIGAALAPARAIPVTKINFDDLPVETIVTDQYASLGV